MATTIDLLKNSAFETKMDALIEAVGGGADAGDMKASVYDPQNKAQDVFAYVDGKIADIPTPDVSAQIAAHNSAEDAHANVLASLDNPSFTTKISVAGPGSFAGKVSAGTEDSPAAPTAANDLCTKAYVDANKGLSQAEGDGRYLQLAGGAMTGALTLSGAPTNDLHAATKKYVDDNKGASVFLKDWAQLPSSSAVGDIYLLYEAE